MLEGAGPAGDAEVVWWRFGLLRVAAQGRGRERASGGWFVHAYATLFAWDDMAGWGGV
jgi:hypothetical protein